MVQGGEESVSRTLLFSIKPQKRLLILVDIISVFVRGAPNSN